MCARVGVVEHDLRAAGKPRELAEGCENRRLRQIGRDAEPQDEGAPGRIKTARLERRRHASVLEVVADEGHMRRLGDAGASEAAALVALGRRMVELEHLEAVIGLELSLEPVGERVEPRAENEDLPHAPADRNPGRVFGESAAHGDEDPQAPPLGPLPGERERLPGVLAENGERQRIGENSAALQRLMRRPMPRRAERRAACAPVLHEVRA